MFCEGELLSNVVLKLAFSYIQSLDKHVCGFIKTQQFLEHEKNQK